MPRIKTRLARPDPNRSACLARLEKARREARDAKIIDANAGRLNREAVDVLEYQWPQPARLSHRFRAENTKKRAS